MILTHDEFPDMGDKADAYVYRALEILCDREETFPCIELSCIGPE